MKYMSFFRARNEFHSQMRQFTEGELNRMDTMSRQPGTRAYNGGKAYRNKVGYYY